MNSILVILSKLFFGSTTSHQRFEDNRSLELIKSVIRKEVFYMSLRILIGIVLTVMVTFSFIQAARAYQVIVSHFENSVMIELFTFGFLTILGLLLLPVLFRMPFKNSKTDNAIPSVDPSSVDLQVVTLKFVQGFIEGLSTK